MSSLLNFARNLVRNSSFFLLENCQKTYLPSWHSSRKMYDHVSTTTAYRRALPVPVKPPKEDEADKLYKLVEVELRGAEPAVLKSYCWFATRAAAELDIKIGKCWKLPKPYHARRCLLKSVFVHKKHRVQYEVRTYFHFMQFHELTGSTADTYLEYIQRNLPEGVAMKVTRVGIQQLPEHLFPSKPQLLS